MENTNDVSADKIIFSPNFFSDWSPIPNVKNVNRGSRAPRHNKKKRRKSYEKVENIEVF